MSDVGDRIDARAPGPGTAAAPSAQAVQVVQERLEVGTREVVTGRVRVVKRVHEREETADLPLRREEVEIRRVAINRAVDRPPAVREEGGVTIVPVLEEVMVVSKQLMLTEELHITRRSFEERRPQAVTLRAEAVETTREPPSPGENG